MIYVWHHVGALVLAVLTAGYLRRARWVGQRPGLAVALWQATGLTMIVALVSGLVALGLMPFGQGIVPGLVSFAAAPRAPLPTAAVSAGLALACWLVGHQVRCAIRIARQRARHGDLLTLLADDREDATVLDHPLALAYCLPGRHRRIVISAGARDLLTGREFAAVLAHERAHLAERHHLALAPFTAVTRLFPRWRTLARIVADIHVLLEMRADDHAARDHGRSAVIAALEKFRAHGAVTTPPGTLAAGTTAVQRRIDRLRRPPARHHRVLPILVTAAVITLFATPLSLLLAPL